MTTTITYPFTDVVAGVNAVMPHVSKDDVTKILTGIYIDAEGAMLATDRYTVGQFTPPTVGIDGEFEGAVIPIEAVKHVAKMRATTLNLGKNMASEYWVAFVFEPEVQDFQIQLGYKAGGRWIVESSATFMAIKGNFPPLARLFPVDDAKFGISGPISLKSQFMARVGVATKWLGDRNDTARYQFMQTDNPNKPGPVFVEVGSTFRALIQPNLLVR